MTQQTDFKPEDHVFFPDTISRLTVQELKKLREDQGNEIMSKLENIDKVMTPFRGNELIPVLGFTNNYKSGLMNTLSKHAAQQLTESNEIVVVCSWEESVEDKGIWDIAEMSGMDTTALDRGEFTDTQWKKILDASIERADKPIYFIGHSDQDMRRRPRLNLEQVWHVLDHLYDYHGKKARMIVLDYLQRIRPISDRRDWRVAMMETVDKAKDMAIAFNVPVVLGTQASRKTRDLANPKMPLLEHAQETSNIEQSASKFFSLCLPIKTMIEGEMVEYAGRSFKVTKNLLFVALLKQKRGPAPAYFAFDVDYSTHVLTPYTRMDLNKAAVWTAQKGM
jgi:replicative DNA helicase